MEQIFDKVVESNGRFEVEQFRIGRTNSEPSYLRLRIETPDADEMEQLLAQLLGLGCSPVEPATPLWAGGTRPLRARKISIPPPITARFVRIGGEWVEVREPAHGRA